MKMSHCEYPYPLSYYGYYGDPKSLERLKT
jgi:hypothetical protein